MHKHKGGAFPGAAAGVRALGGEIRAWWESEKEKRRSGTGGGTAQEQNQRLAVLLPAGTGTTAWGLARALMMASTPAADDDDITVYAVPCVGDGGYLRRQMRRLAGAEGEGWGPWPVVLEGEAPHVFARPEEGRYVWGLVWVGQGGVTVGSIATISTTRLVNLTC